MYTLCLCRLQNEKSAIVLDRITKGINFLFIREKLLKFFLTNIFFLISEAKCKNIENKTQSRQIFCFKFRSYL